jgi:hypothetical protein
VTGQDRDQQERDVGEDQEDRHGDESQHEPSGIDPDGAPGPCHEACLADACAVTLGRSLLKASSA